MKKDKDKKQESPFTLRTRALLLEAKATEESCYREEEECVEEVIKEVIRFSRENNRFLRSAFRASKDPVRYYYPTGVKCPVCHGRMIQNCRHECDEMACGYIDQSAREVDFGNPPVRKGPLVRAPEKGEHVFSCSKCGHDTCFPDETPEKPHCQNCGKAFSLMRFSNTDYNQRCLS